MRVLSSALVVLLLVPATTLAGTFPGLNGRLLFTDITGPAYHFSSTKPDGSDYKTVLGGSVSKLDVEYSPDGTKIAYVQGVSSTQQVFVANADGSNPQQITTSSTQTYSPSWSPDGTKILYSQVASSDIRIVRMNADGTNQVQITSTGVYYDPEYSPDGTKIAALLDASDDEVVVMNADGSNIVNVTNNSVEDRRANWSPNGNKLIYASATGGDREIFTMNPDGSNKVQLTTSALGFHSPEYSPDGTKITFIDSLAPSLIYVADADGSDMVQIPAGWARDISWQPLTHAPASVTPNPTVSLMNGRATIGIASMYTDRYEGIDTASVAVTSPASFGTTSIDSATGSITYTPRTNAMHSSFGQRLARLFAPIAHGAATDNFTYRVCSLTNNSLCSSGTVTVNLLIAPSTGAGRPDNSTYFHWALILLSLSSLALGAYRLRSRS